MDTVSWLQITSYVFVVLIVVAFATKLLKYARMPRHLRWELYPLPGESNRPWGGSYLEESDWWDKPQESKNFMGEMSFMGQEVLFFKEYFHRNRNYWYLVYPFHMAIFLFVGFFALLIVGAITTATGVDVSADSGNVWGQIVHYVTLVVGVAGFALGVVSCVGVFIKRLTDKNLRLYTERSGYFNLLFVFAVFVTGLLAWAISDNTFSTAREFTESLITFDGAEAIEALIAAHIILLALLLLYMPFTNMMHFFAKWFTFHMVRWDDVPNLRGSKLEKELGPLLTMPVSWSAPHIQGINRWADVATVSTGKPTGPRVAETTAEEQSEQSQKEVS